MTASTAGATNPMCVIVTSEGLLPYQSSLVNQQHVMTKYRDPTSFITNWSL